MKLTSFTRLVSLAALAASVYAASVGTSTGDIKVTDAADVSPVTEALSPAVSGSYIDVEMLDPSSSTSVFEDLQVLRVPGRLNITEGNYRRPELEGSRNSAQVGTQTFCTSLDDSMGLSPTGTSIRPVVAVSRMVLWAQSRDDVKRSDYKLCSLVECDVWCQQRSAFR